MANSTVNDLAELTTPAADDYLIIWDTSAGQTRRIRQDKVMGGLLTGGGVVATNGKTLNVPVNMTAAGIDVANIFSQPQGINQIRMPQVTLANGATFTLSASAFGLLIIQNASTGGQALLWLAAGPNAVVASNIRAGFSITQNNANTVNVYYQAGVGFVVQNNTGSTAIINYLMITL